MDPTGLLAPILSGLAILYWGIAALLLWLALAKLKTWQNKAIVATSVVCVFGYLPASSVWEAKLRAYKHARACESSAPTVGSIEPVSGFFAESGTLDRATSFNFLAGYLVKRHMTFIEVDAETASHLYMGIHPGPPSASLKIFLAQQGDPACQWFDVWKKEYASQRIPPLRQGGLQPDQCIGIAQSSAQESRYGMFVTTRPISVTYGEYGIWEHLMQVRDLGNNTIAAAFPLVVNHDGYHNEVVQCGREAEAKKFRDIIPIVPDSRYQIVATEIIDDTPARVTGPATAKDIAQSKGMRGVMKDFTTNIIDSRGVTWFESRYLASGNTIALSGYALATLRGDKLHKTFVALSEGSQVRDLTGLLATDKEVRFIAMNHDRTQHWLMVYSSDGIPARALTLTYEQLKALKEP